MNPVFILGNPRSGTSLLRIMLNAHPNIVVPPESGFLQWWYNKYKNWTDLSYEQLKEFVDDLLSSKKIENFNFNRTELLNYLYQNNPKRYAELIELVYIFYGRHKNIKVWGDKNNYYIHHIPLLKQLYPKARFIHVIRDGRDVACSYLELNKIIETTDLYAPQLPKKIDEIAKEWVTNNKTIAAELLLKEHIEIRYEDLVLNTREELEKVLCFLKVNWSNQVMKYYNFNDEPASTIKWKMKTKLPPLSSNVNQYKKKLSKMEITSFNQIARRVLSRYHYDI